MDDAETTKTLAVVPRRGRPKRKPPETGERPRLTEAQWLGLRREFANFDLRKEPWPSTATLGQIALAAKVSRQAIVQWRRNVHYRQGLIWLVSKEMTDKRKAKSAPKPKSEEYADKWERFPAPAKRNAMISYLQERWTGPMQLPGNRHRFTSSEELADYLIANRLIPADWRPSAFPECKP